MGFDFSGRILYIEGLDDETGLGHLSRYYRGCELSVFHS